MKRYARVWTFLAENDVINVSLHSVLAVVEWLKSPAMDRTSHSLRRGAGRQHSNIDLQPIG